MSEVAEGFAGAPARAGRGPGGPGRGPGGPGGGGPGGPPGGPGGDQGKGRGKGGGRPPMTPEQQAAMQKAAAEMKDWRLSVSMDKYKAFRKNVQRRGSQHVCFKLAPTMNMSDQEYDYIWNVAATLGANHIRWNCPRTTPCCNGSASTRRSASCGSRSILTGRAESLVFRRRLPRRPTTPPSISNVGAFLRRQWTISRARHGEVSRPDREPAP